jgi:hypothetical protein
MKTATCLAVLLFLAPSITVVGAQVPLPFQSGVRAPSELSSELADSIRRTAGGYTFRGFHMFSRDSVLLVFEDSSLTAAALKAETWMFGPPATVAEADGCPPEKVLGRKIARVFWRGRGKPADLKSIMIAVTGTKGIDRWTAMTMFYYPRQLDGPWVGEPNTP